MISRMPSIALATEGFLYDWEANSEPAAQLPAGAPARLVHLGLTIGKLQIIIST